MVWWVAFLINSKEKAIKRMAMIISIMNDDNDDGHLLPSILE